MNAKPNGFTLIEVVFAATISVVIMGGAVSVIMQVWKTGSAFEMRSAARMDAQRALDRISRELGQASRASLSVLPGDSIRYRIPADTDGDGTALDTHGQPEWSEERVIQRDTADANHDGLGAEQLLLVNGSEMTVLANGLAPATGQEDAAHGGGAWFEAVPGGVRVNIREQRTTHPGGQTVVEALAETIFVRNP